MKEIDLFHVMSSDVVISGPKVTIYNKAHIIKCTPTKNITFTKILKIILFHQKSQSTHFCPAARIEMSIMNSHLVENVLANTIKYK